MGQAGFGEGQHSPSMEGLKSKPVDSNYRLLGRQLWSKLSLAGWLLYPHLISIAKAPAVSLGLIAL